MRDPINGNTSLDCFGIHQRANAAILARLPNTDNTRFAKKDVVAHPKIEHEHS